MDLCIHEHHVYITRPRDPLVKKRLKEKLGEGPESRLNMLLNMRASLKISEQVELLPDVLPYLSV